jgi:hypothetical protein
VPTVRVFEYVPELDAFLITEEFQRLAAYLGLIEWHAAVWIGRLFMLDNDYGEHWFDNWDEREAVEEKARELGLESYDLMIINAERLANGQDGPCHSSEQRKRFWTDVLKSLELSYELLFEEARQNNAEMKQLEERIRETNPSWKESIDDLEERIRHLREGGEIPSEDHEPPR